MRGGGAGSEETLTPKQHLRVALAEFRKGIEVPTLTATELQAAIEALGEIVAAVVEMMPEEDE